MESREVKSNGVVRGRAPHAHVGKMPPKENRDASRRKDGADLYTELGMAEGLSIGTQDLCATKPGLGVSTESRKAGCSISGSGKAKTILCILNRKEEGETIPARKDGGANEGLKRSFAHLRTDSESQSHQTVGVSVQRMGSAGTKAHSGPHCELHIFHGRLGCRGPESTNSVSREAKHGHAALFFRETYMLYLAGLEKLSYPQLTFCSLAARTLGIYGLFTGHRCHVSGAGCARTVEYSTHSPWNPDKAGFSLWSSCLLGIFYPSFFSTTNIPPLLPFPPSPPLSFHLYPTPLSLQTAGRSSPESPPEPRMPDGYRYGRASGGRGSAALASLSSESQERLTTSRVLGQVLGLFRSTLAQVDGCILGSSL
ncbi:hypothetical protein B0H14DRAFT_2566059 [Mycena olivaceomarginata]|nr:hypothetical protein B0H14DRAFT_2566059 [Mycena olivaceomarginata]